MDGEESNDGVGLPLEERLRRKGISRTGETPTTTKRSHPESDTLTALSGRSRSESLQSAVVGN